jgi:O-glycosyl hydrolase
MRAPQDFQNPESSIEYQESDPRWLAPRRYGLDDFRPKAETDIGFRKARPKRKMKTLKSSIGRTAVFLSFLWIASRVYAVSITIDGSQTNQYIDGFGVNANYWSYTNSDLNPVLDALVDQAGMTLFRVVFNNGWETNNDNDDPDVMNQSYYNTLYSGPEFQKLWGLLHYLEQKGLSDSITLNFQGPGPAWMGGNTMAEGMEDEWAEMVVSLLLYARTNQHLLFHMVAPDNEPNIASEGIYVDTAAQYITMLEKLAQKLDAYGLSDFQFVVPDRTDGSTNFFPEIMNDPIIMAKVAHFGAHSYGADMTAVSALVAGSPFPDRRLWVTEFNVWCQVCETGGQGTNDWEYFRETADYLLDDLAQGASVGQVWEAYDSYYPHHGDWSFWGLFSVDDPNASPRTYTPRKNFYTLSQISKYVPPGSRVIGIEGSPGSLKLQVCFNDALGQLTVTGMNADSSPVNLSGTLSSLPVIRTLALYYTSSSTNLARISPIQMSDNVFNAVIPADCVFTLTGMAAPPQLSAANVGGSLVISWPACANCILESAANVNQSNGWSMVTNTPQSAGQAQRVTITPTESRQFYRLRLP